MKKYKIETALLTVLEMNRLHLMTKEKAKSIVEGKKLRNAQVRNYRGSINDDLELYLNKFLNTEQITNEWVESYFFPKLTEEERKLVERRDKEHMMTYQYNAMRGQNADVDPEEMKLSDSKDKYVHGACWRKTYYLTVEKNQTSVTKAESTKKFCTFF